MTPRKIIFASAHRFKPTLRLGTSYLAEAFAKRGWEVLFIEQPTSLFHMIHPAKSRIATDKFKKAARTIWQGNPMVLAEPVSLLNVVSLIPHVNVPAFRSSATLEHWWRMTFPSVTREIRERGFANASALVFDSPFFFPLARATETPSVYRYADRMREFSEVTPAMRLLEERIFREADLVFYTSKALENDLADRKGPVLHLPNGVDIDAYGNRPPEPAELSTIPEPRVIYSGTIGRWFDAGLIRAAARELDQIQFVLLGNLPPERTKLADIPNVHLLGEKSFERVPEFLLHCQAAIIPFDVDGMPDLVGAINPLKLYEYCAAGLPVVTYVSEEIAAGGAPVDFYRSKRDFIELIRDAIRADSTEKRQARKAWAATASWDLRAAELERTLARI
ncbi:glycosyltransferase [Mesorhizobium sp. AaZ16]|uniref:GumK N-terminal domain-containing glycosyltransferase n=1 Tax=Mesorhizobium sp. AaZ16 TaxID=3402289 RepID=UPI00374FA84E